ncbi:MAG: putative CRISPR-associated protein [Pseudanabaenaceae cyanobacterium SKYGB_i_bin29]|nr:putative CRISPR-associated protein [Pseudanabaenaceae cyanobacterium SKYG29]MDW8420434.1 putative CRISPR-associated protein [Pseudanabaenaceae cyanobacterium SKYGB_i_bin29]
MKPRFIISPCGTSILTNGATEEQRRLCICHANVRKPEEVSETDRQVLLSRIDEVQQKLIGADVETAAKMSAELNGIITFYSRKVEQKQDFHYLVCTDTWLGEVTAELVQTWLLDKVTSQVQIYRQKDLRTANLLEFQFALSELVGWIDETVTGYRNSNYQIVFNLTGGFKSVQGFLQALANFYADETIYIFENATELLRIPRMPVRMIVEEEIKNNLQTFRRLAENLPVTEQEVSSIPDILLLEIDGRYGFSAWGELQWRQIKDSIYSQEILPSPSPKIRYGDRFLDSTKGLMTDRYVILNCRIDQLACYLERPDQPNPNSLDFKLIKNPYPPSTHEMDAWSDLDAKRLYGHFEDNVFVLDRLDKHL